MMKQYVEYVRIEEGNRKVEIVFYILKVDIALRRIKNWMTKIKLNKVVLIVKHLYIDD